MEMADLNRQPVLRQMPVESSADVVLVRQTIEKLAERFGFSARRKAEAVLVASELAQNHVNCGTLHGRITAWGVWCGCSAQLTIFSMDEGPGIREVEKVLRDGVTSGRSYGSGLGAVRRLSDDFAICSGRSGSLPCVESSPAYTMVAASLCWPPGDIPLENMKFSALITPFPGEEFCGDGVHVKTEGHLTRIVLMDVLGHGVHAAGSISRAHEILNAMSPGEMLEHVAARLDRALYGDYRGMSALFMVMDTVSGEMHTCGVGNIGACFHDGSREMPVTSQAGVIGQHINCRRLMIQHFMFCEKTACVMYSDGLLPDVALKYLGRDMPPLFDTYLGLLQASCGNDDASLVAWQWLKR